MDGDLQNMLYKALQSESDEEVIRLCNMVPEGEGPFYVCSIHNSTVLHTAIYLHRFELAEKILDNLSDSLLSRIVGQTNDLGDTVLHAATTAKKKIDLVKKLVFKAPALLHTCNHSGESALFRATQYGKRNAFQFLLQEVDKYCEFDPEFDRLLIFQRYDQTTILHLSILMGYFDMALTLATKYPELHNLRAQGGMIPLQILSCMPSAFKSGTKLGFLERRVYSCNLEEGATSDGAGQSVKLRHKILLFIIRACQQCCTLPVAEEIQSLKKSHENAFNVAKILIKSDFSWRDTYKQSADTIPVVYAANAGTKDEGHSSKQHKEAGKSPLATSLDNTQQDVDDDNNDDRHETALFMATRKGCIEIVEEIIKQYPMAAEYINRDQQTMLHLAVKNRNWEIFRLVQRKVRVFKSLARAVDNQGNSLLHMIGYPGDALVEPPIKSPVLKLSEDLQLLQNLKQYVPEYLLNHRNNQMMTADELFAKTNEELRNEAREWLKRTSEHCTVVIVLIATVAFAAAYTIPGGPNQATGVPVLLGRPFFLVFTVTDVLSLGFALTAVVIFLSILTSSYQLKEFASALPQKLLLGLTLLFLSVSMMMLSFAATIILMINNRERWTKIAVYIVAFFPVCIFVLSYIPLYIRLAQIFEYWAKQFFRFLPRCVCALRRRGHTSDPTEVEIESQEAPWLTLLRG